MTTRDHPDAALIAALRQCQQVLARLTNPPIESTVQHAFASAVAAEIRARNVLAAVEAAAPAGNGGGE